MWRLTCFLLLCFQLHLGTSQLDLGQQINQQVQDSLKGTENLGADIAANVQQQLAPLQNLGANIRNQVQQSLMPVHEMDLSHQIHQQVYDSLRGTDNLGLNIMANVNQQLAPLQNLGANINHQVQQSLMPVYAMSIKNNMANGVGGTTVATYYGNRPRSFIIQNGIRSVCNGNIVGAQCLGRLEEFDIETREDFCYTKSYASVNNRLCLGSDQINVQVFNNHFHCESTDGSPTIILTRKQYRNLCGNRMPWQVMYKYYANPNDSRAIEIPNSNPYVKCLNNERGVCEFEGEQATGSGSGTVFSSSNSFNYVHH